ncbi:MAG: YitT family protein [Oscillospiraceae bacterium]|nr:YitT family protein [Oscillospiraceae bacterium]
MVFELKLRSCLINLLGSAILAFGMYNIHSISGVTEGGVLGMTLFFEHHLSVSPAVTGLILNALCYILGAKKLGKEFIGYSLFAGGGFSLFYAICEQFPPVYPQIAYYPLAAALVGAIFIGIGAGLCVRAGGAPSGDDALAMSISHSLSCDINLVYLASDIFVLALSLSYIPLKTIAYSLLTVVLSGAIIGFIHRAGRASASPDLKTDPRDVLVGTLRNRMQLETCIKNSFYHIPAARLSAGDFPVHYVAIYQSNHKFFDNAGVFYWGEVKKCSLVPRYKITEIPKNSREMYYRFDINEWRKLENPILAREGDFVSITTTRYLLENAREVPELRLHSREELSLYRKISSCISGEAPLHKTSCNNAEIVFDGGRITVHTGRAEVFSCTYDEFSKRPTPIFRAILSAATQGGRR